MKISTEFLNPDAKPDPEVIALQRGHESRTMIDCFIAGWNSVVHGSNESNCHFTLFSSPGRTEAWQDGRDQANIHKSKL